LIDIHCHILTGIDDGASDMEESIAMVRHAHADGIRTIVATPHTMNGVYENYGPNIITAVDRLRRILVRENIDIDILPGSEIHICTDLMEKVTAGQLLLIGRTRENNPGCMGYALIELPFQVLPPGYRNALFRLKLRGIIPIIAHPERNLVIQNHPERLEELVKMGCLVQVTAMSVTGGFGDVTMDCAHRLIESRMAHIIASDAHNADTRPPELSLAAETAADILDDENAADDMVDAIPKALIQGRLVTPPEPVQPVEKGWFSKIQKMIGY